MADYYTGRGSLKEHFTAIKAPKSEDFYGVHLDWQRGSPHACCKDDPREVAIGSIRIGYDTGKVEVFHKMAGSRVVTAFIIKQEGRLFS
jgi:hypothetical protein